MQRPGHILLQWLLFLPLVHKESNVLATVALFHSYDFCFFFFFFKLKQWNQTEPHFDPHLSDQEAALVFCWQDHTGLFPATFCEKAFKVKKIIKKNKGVTLFW